MWQIALTTFCRLILNTARRFIYPFAPALSRDLQVPLVAVTSLIAATQASSLAGLFIGPFADRWGYRNMMRTGMALLAVGMLMCWIAPLYGFVFAGLLLAGAGKTAYDPAIQAFIGRQIPFARRGLAIGCSETAWAGSTLIGIPVMALIISNFGLRWAFFAMAVIGAVGWMVLGRLIPADSESPGGKKDSPAIATALFQLVRKRPAAGMLGFGFLISLASDNLFVVYGAWLEQDFGMGIVALGMSTSLLGAAELSGETLTALFGDRIGLKRAMMIGAGTAAAGYFILPMMSFSLYYSLAGLFLIFCAFEFTMVCSFSLGTELMPAARATMMAGFFTAAGTGRMAGALIGSELWINGGLWAVAFTSAVAMASAVVCLLWGLQGWTAGE